MTYKHITFEESEVLRELEKIALLVDEEVPNLGKVDFTPISDNEWTQWGAKVVYDTLAVIPTPITNPIAIYEAIKDMGEIKNNPLSISHWFDFFTHAVAALPIEAGGFLAPFLKYTNSMTEVVRLLRSMPFARRIILFLIFSIRKYFSANNIKEILLWFGLKFLGSIKSMPASPTEKLEAEQRAKKIKDIDEWTSKCVEASGEIKKKMDDICQQLQNAIQENPVQL